MGPGCPKCKKLEENVRKAVEELGLQADVVKEEDMMKIMGYGVNLTPAIAVDGKVVMNGCVPDVAKIKELLADAGSK